MATSCARPFDEELLSGYLDGALPQRQAQRVRLHVEDCGECRRLLAEIETLRSAAMETRFGAPEEEQWPELPATRPSWFSRSLGWTVVVTWALAVTAVAVWRFVSNTGDPFEIFLGLGLPGGLLLLFVSVLLDRLRDLKTDRYTGVHR